jgi:hypothetical protein
LGHPIWGNVIGTVQETVIDLSARHETVELDRVRAFDLDLLEFVVFLAILTLPDLVAATNVFFLDDLARSESTSCCLRRLPIFLLMRVNEIRSALDDAGKRANGQETSESCR